VGSFRLPKLLLLDRPALQHVPAILGDSQGVIRFEFGKSRRKTLRRSSENFFELATEMGFVSKSQFIGGGFIGIALGDEFSGQAALQFSEPMTGSAMQVLAK